MAHLLRSHGVDLVPIEPGAVGGAVVPSCWLRCGVRQRGVRRELASDVVDRVCEKLGVSRERLRSSSRMPELTRARCAIAWACRAYLGLGLAETARLIRSLPPGRGPTECRHSTVIRLVRRACMDAAVFERSVARSSVADVLKRTPSVGAA